MSFASPKAILSVNLRFQTYVDMLCFEEYYHLICLRLSATSACVSNDTRIMKPYVFWLHPAAKPVTLSQAPFDGMIREVSPLIHGSEGAGSSCNFFSSFFFKNPPKKSG